MTDGPARPPQPRGTLIRAANGDVIRWDETGIDMVLSDQVIADIARRLPPAPAPVAAGQPVAPAATEPRPDPRILGDRDIWDLRLEEEWLSFAARLPGRQGTRRFRRLRQGEPGQNPPAIIAETAAGVCGLIGLGGQRHAVTLDERPAFPWHIVSAGDEVGPQGAAGTARTEVSDTFANLHEISVEVALADCLLAARHRDFRSLPLFFARAETGGDTSIAALPTGEAFANFATALASLRAAGARAGLPQRLAAVLLSFTLEQIDGDGQAWRDGMFALLAAIRDAVGRAGLRMPPCLAVFDCGTPRLSDHPVLRAQWDLAWMGQCHGLIYTAPGYMFAQDDAARPTPEALWQQAEMAAEALLALERGEGWGCPTLLLAEREPDPAVIRVRAQAAGPLVLDPADPFGAGPLAGFRLENVANGAAITGVALAPDDPRDVLLTCDRPPEGAGLTLLYAFGAPPRETHAGLPAACGALRDGWSGDSRTGTTLHRWALPAALPVH